MNTKKKSVSAKAKPAKTKPYYVRNQYIPSEAEVRIEKAKSALEKTKPVKSKTKSTKTKPKKGRPATRREIEDDRVAEAALDAAMSTAGFDVFKREDYVPKKAKPSKAKPSKAKPVKAKPAKAKPAKAKPAKAKPAKAKTERLVQEALDAADARFDREQEKKTQVQHARARLEAEIRQGQIREVQEKQKRIQEAKERTVWYVIDGSTFVMQVEGLGVLLVRSGHPMSGQQNMLFIPDAEVFHNAQQQVRLRKARHPEADVAGDVAERWRIKMEDIRNGAAPYTWEDALRQSEAALEQLGITHLLKEPKT